MFSFTKSKTNKQDASTKYNYIMEDIDPNILAEKILTFHHKDFNSEENFVECNRILDEFLTVRAITRKPYIVMHSKLNLW